MPDGADGYITTDDGVRLVWCLDGPPDAPVLLLANSLGTDLRLWDGQIPALAARFRVLRYDMRGHGQSDAPEGPYTLDRLGGDALALLDAQAVSRAHVCGISLGGMVAMWLATRHLGRVERLILADTAARIGTWDSWNERIQAVRDGGMPAIRERVVGRFLSAAFREREPEITDWLGEMLLATPAAGYVAACQALQSADLGAKVGHIRAPTLILAGALDESTPPAQAKELHAAITGSELIILDDAAHLPNIERPDAFNAQVLAFLTKRGDADVASHTQA